VTSGAPYGLDSIETIDGSSLVVRPIQPSDSEALDAAFHKLSAESRYRRFLHPVNHLARRDLEYLTCVDHVAHEALIALDPGGEIVAVARFIREDDRSERAEVAITVADSWQRRGVGTQILQRLATRAGESGVEVFTAICLEDNKEMFDLFRELGATTTHRSAGTADIEVEVALPADSPAHVLGAALKAAAADEAQAPPLLTEP